MEAAALSATLVLPEDLRHTGSAPIQPARKKVGIVGEEPAKREYGLMAFPLRMEKQSEAGGLI